MSDMKVMYAYLDTDKNQIEISAYKPDAEEYENNHTIIKPGIYNSSSRIMEVEFFFGILVNIFYQAGVRLERFN